MLRLILLPLLSLLCYYPLFAQFYPINGEDGWTLLDAQGKTQVPLQSASLFVNPDQALNLYPSIFHQEDGFVYYRSAKPDLLPLQIDSLFVGEYHENYKHKTNTRRYFDWRHISNSDSLQRGLARNKIGSEPSIRPLLMAHSEGYILLDQEGTCIYEGTEKPRLIHHNHNLFEIKVGDKSSCWQVSPRRYLSAPKEDLWIFRLGEVPDFMGIGYKEDSQYVHIFGAEWQDTLINSNLLYPMQDSLFAVKSNDGDDWGLIDRHGDTLAPIAYDRNFVFHAEYIEVSRGGGEFIGIVVDGEEVFPPKFGRVIRDEGNHFWVYPQKGWALADGNGKLLTGELFRRPGRFQGPVAVVRGARGWGLINQYGEVLAPTRYKGVQVLDNVARLKSRDSIIQVSFDDDGRYTPVKRLIVKGTPPANEADTVAVDSTIRNEWFSTDKGFGIRNAAQGVVLPPTFDYVRTIPSQPVDVIAVSVVEGREHRYGLYDPQALRTVIPPGLGYIFFEDFASQRVARGLQRNGYYVLIRPDGKIKKLERVNYISEFENGVAIACADGKPQLRSITRPLLGRNPFIESDTISGKWGLLRTNGKWLIPPVHQHISLLDSNFLLVQDQNKWGLMNRSGQMQIEATYDSLYALVDGANGVNAPYFASVRKAPRQFFVSPSGELQHVQELEDQRLLEGNYIAAKQKGKWGLISPDGQWVVSPKHEALGEVGEEKIAFKTAQGWGYLNLQGEVVFKPSFSRAKHFAYSAAPVNVGKRWGYLKSDGTWLLEPSFMVAEPFVDSLAIAKDKNGYGLLLPDGSWALKPKYSRIKRDGSEFTCSRKGGEELLRWNPKEGKFIEIAVLGGGSSMAENYRLMFPQIQSSDHHVLVLDEYHKMGEDLHIGTCETLKGIVDQYGNEILPMEFEEIAYYQGVYVLVWHGRLGYYGPKGWLKKPEGYK